MGWFHREEAYIPPHRRREPEITLPLCLQSVEEIFGSCCDFGEQTIRVGQGGETATLCWLEGMVRMERVSEYLICPLSRLEGWEKGRLGDALLSGGVWAMAGRRGTDMDEVCQSLAEGSVVLFLEEGGALIFSLSTEEKRSIDQPQVESSVKGAKDAFVESLRTNTSLVRRRLKTPFLRVEEELVGRQSRTPVDLLWVEGLTNRSIVEELRRRLAEIDIDGVVANGNLEEYLTKNTATAFPQILFTERPDRLCGGLLEGRAAILVEGLPCGYLVPGDIGQFLRAPQDKNYHYVTSSALSVLRWLCLLTTLFLPGVYVAMVTFHLEMLPTKLMESIIVSKQSVPFGTAVEVVGLLIAFEILQEAGLRLPQNIGQTVSIIGGLVVGQSAVEAKIVSPVVIIVVAVAGIAGYTMPNQDFANALRIWRFLITLAGGVAGLFGVSVAGLVLAAHLAGLEDFGVSYLSPFAPKSGERGGLSGVLRLPLRKTKLREGYLHPENKRNQR